MKSHVIGYYHVSANHITCFNEINTSFVIHLKFIRFVLH